MSKTPDIIVLGHHGCGARQVRVHHIPVAGETVAVLDSKIIKDGGKGSHQAMVIGRLGGDVGFIGKISTDAQADVALQWLIDDHVNVTHLLRMEYKLAGAGMIMVDDDGNNAIVSVGGIRETLTFDEVKPCLQDFKNSKIFITGFEIPLKTALESAKLAKEFGMFTILNPAPALEEFTEILDYIDIIIPNETEARILAGYDVRAEVDPHMLAKSILEKYRVGLVIITLGNKGLFSYDGKESWSSKPIVVAAVDTTGAGDTFIGAFTYAMSGGKSLCEAMEWANYAAALSVTRPGSIPSFPTKQEVEEFVEIQNSED